MLAVVEADAANCANLFSCKRRQELLDVEDFLGRLCWGVEC